MARLVSHRTLSILFTIWIRHCKVKEPPVWKAQRVRCAHQAEEPGTVSRRTPFCASSSEKSRRKPHGSIFSSAARQANVSYLHARHLHAVRLLGAQHLASGISILSPIARRRRAECPPNQQLDFRHAVRHLPGLCQFRLAGRLVGTPARLLPLCHHRRHPHTHLWMTTPMWAGPSSEFLAARSRSPGRILRHRLFLAVRNHAGRTLSDLHSRFRARLRV